MTNYGVISEGFNRKPLAVALAEIEASLITEFGPNVIQTPQSPLGQINGLMADLVSALWELAEDVYQSYDPDQAEGTRLDTLGSIRLISRQANEPDASFRQAITNSGQARVDLQDIARAIAAIDGVTYQQVWVNDTGELDANGMPAGSICIAVVGGDDSEIGAAIREYVVPGVTVYGNTIVESLIDGYCRSFRILRPIDVPVTLTVNIRKERDSAGCPPPSDQAIENFLVNNISFLNGEDVTHYKIRSLLESQFANVEVLSISGSRDGLDLLPSVNIGFIERASLSMTSVMVVSV
ncbi:baseplate wedge subunit [Rhizobium phage RHEph06]|uniref:Putative baseplate assembly protein n=2 Tax=Kleczkowskavirus RHEph4 TaxID=1921526 RepID=L7TN06_9CAUD|nr:baseplate wedge subunit [Rhizobium phage RHEph06]YP_009598475.1 baseplate wedge subunit [Rhizobium phage RHEph04]AGC35795.1 putative baseplate assembly protein [Rhizobium phage RHEph05]QXV74912.1 baseplate assembly protein J [Rhizobium phage RHEph26]AGC35719.1 putative baseplate assembly protein [Rhizobium phage RHEph04]AGC35876.1 putative baseplate assembly protein [Rhizobium phage RHEph06]